ncbi:MAG: MMPL family transporter [Treponema sp.]|nr:MMPL family transporter [Treponema sp.]
MEVFFRRPRITAGVIGLITLFFGFQLSRARMDNNIMAFLPEDIPERIIARHFEEEYGDEIAIMVGLERPYGTIFDRPFLMRIREFTDAAENIDLVKETDSIMSTRYITSDSESIIVTDLVAEDFSGSDEEIAELKRRIASWDMYQGSLVSGDLSATQIVITLNAAPDESGDPEVAAVLIRLREMAKEMFRDFANVYTTGQPVVSTTLSEAAYTDLFALVPLVFVVLLAVLLFSFRRAVYVALPLLTVVIAVIWAVGAMPLFGVTLTMLSITLPVILMAVGSAYAIHLISHYRDEAEAAAFTVEEHRAFILALTRKLLKPVFLAALTTFAGFISFCFAPLTPMRDFGIFASFGVLAAFAVAVTLVPAILLIRGPRTMKAPARKGREKTSGPGVERTMVNGRLARALTAVAEKKTTVLCATALAAVVSIMGASRLVVDNAMVEFFSPDSEVNRSDRFIREHFGGSAQLIVSVEADTETLLSPEVLSAVDGLSAYLTGRVAAVGSVTGFTDLVKRMNQMFNVDEPPEGVRQTARAAGGEIGAHDDSAFEFGDFGFGGFDTFDSFDIDEFGGFGFTGAEFGGVAGADTGSPVAPAEGGSAGPQGRSEGGDEPASLAVPPPASSDTPVSFAMINAAAGKQANMSANDLVRELERMVNYGGYGYYEIPADPGRYGKQSSEELQQLVANYLVLLAGDNRMSNDPLEPTAIETVILINSQWQKDTQRVMEEVNGYIEANFPKNVRVLVGGGAAQEGALSVLVMNSQIVSIFVSVLIVLLIVAFSNKSLAAGLVAALPLSIAILGNFAVMGFLGITLNMATAMIASLAVGIGIDYTIHFIEAFKREYEATAAGTAGGDYLYRTFAGSGKAILINAVSVGAGFFVLAFSRFRIMAQFGGLVALSMAISALVSLTVIPVLLTTVKPKFIYGNNGASR